MKPPDSLLTQLNLYAEEKYEDEEDVRERAKDLITQVKRGHTKSHSDFEGSLDDLIHLAKQHSELYPTMLDILKRFSQLLQRDIGL